MSIAVARPLIARPRSVGQGRTVNYLLHVGGNANATDHDQRVRFLPMSPPCSWFTLPAQSCLHLAAMSGNESVVQLLCKSNVRRFLAANSLLHRTHVAECAQFGVLDVRTPDGAGRPPAQLAAALGYKEIATYLVSFRARDSPVPELTLWHRTGNPPVSTGSSLPGLAESARPSTGCFTRQ